MVGKMGGELPKRDIGNAEDGAADDKGGMTAAADPVVTNWQGGEEADRQRPHTQPKPRMGIYPKQTPDDSVGPSPDERSEEPVTDVEESGLSGHQGGKFWLFQIL
ncbi:hypothetical protein [Rubritalea profundi]|uniref:hypothetical protein n=1 Tax=Rubritalea profundi TaxID=1658618 RepID=UPI0013FD2F99|nr:hypothetical protein [Rubritalea profundi]